MSDTHVGKREIERRWLMNLEDFNTIINYNGNIKLTGQVATIYFNNKSNKNPKSGHKELRFRRIYYYDTQESIYKVTYKEGKGINRQEEEFDCDKNLFELLSQKYKTMYFNYFKEERISKDFIFKHVILSSKNQLVLIENEFESEEEAKKFELPEYLHQYDIKEVTEDTRFSNYNLYKRYKSF